MGTIAGDVDIAAVAGLLADRSRTAILLALSDGRALAATTLAGEAGVAASTASAHLARLVDAGLLTVRQQGRHRYYQLAGPRVAELLETLASVAPAVPVRSLRQGTRAQAVRAGRTCYDHLAGRLGTALMTALLDRRILAAGDGGYRLTEDGRRRLAGLGVDLSPRTRRPLVRYCVDWSEQRHHLAGALGAALLARLEDLDWVRRSGPGRAVRLTDAGRIGLAETFGTRLGDPADPARG